MADRVRTYTSDDLDVHFSPRRCIHAAECVHGRPEVFDPNQKPWIDPEQAGADAIAEVVVRCPTGALTFTRKDGGAEEATPTHNKVTIAAQGPLFARGDLRVETPDGEMLLEDTRVALCRCGLSKNKPFCDNSHLDQFEAGGQLGTHNATASNGETALQIILAENGPLLVRGPVTLTSADGATMETAKCALCRCGHSSNKPFCDGTHKTIGFEAPGGLAA